MPALTRCSRCKAHCRAEEHHKNKHLGFVHCRMCQCVGYSPMLVSAHNAFVRNRYPSELIADTTRNKRPR